MKTLKRTTLFFFALTATTLLLACKKNDTGGKAEIHAHIQHHDTEIMSSTVYVKFNAKEAPGDPTTNFDLKAEGEDTDNHVHISELRPGHYYLYVVGFDPSISKVVRGGKAVEIKWKDRKQTLETIIEVGE